MQKLRHAEKVHAEFLQFSDSYAKVTECTEETKLQGSCNPLLSQREKIAGISQKQGVNTVRPVISVSYKAVCRVCRLGLRWVNTDSVII